MKILINCSLNTQKIMYGVMTNHSFRYNLGQLEFKMAFDQHILLELFLHSIEEPKLFSI